MLHFLVRVVQKAIEKYWHTFSREEGRTNQVLWCLDILCEAVTTD